MSHALVEQQLEDGSVHNYYCVQCAMEYESIDDFIEYHHSNEESIIKENLEDCTEVSQWEAIDDVIEYEGPTEDNASMDTSHQLQGETIDKEFVLGSDAGASVQVVEEDDIIQEELGEEAMVVKMEDDPEENKYYCYDCRTVFRDFQIAESHDCPGIGNALEEEDPCKNLVQNVTDPIADGLTEYMCAYCDQTFVDLSDLVQHQVTCSDDNTEMIVPDENIMIQCSVCAETFATIKELNAHNRMHKTKSKEDNENVEQKEISNSCLCHICNTQFSNARSLRLHLRIHKDRPMRRIQEALPKIAAQKYNRLDHFFCEICNKSFDQNLLAVHKSMHQNIEEYICKICNRQFKNKESFEIHQQVHSSSANSQKSIINSGPTDAALRNAKKGVKSMHVANAKKTFPCQYCGHLFWRPHEKVRHEYVHTGEKPYPCEVCGKRFRVPYSLTLHLRTHTNIRPYVCPHCNKRFKSHSVYTHHMRIHLNDRDYECDVCGKSFRTTVQLYSHKNIHTKPFNCTLCSRPFASLFAVKAHMKSHSKSKVFENLKYSCNICGAVYGALRALRAHKKEIHEIEFTENFHSTFDSQNEKEGTRSADEHYEADEAAMMLLRAVSEANDKHEQDFPNFDNNESLDNYYLNNGTVSGLESI